MAYEVPPLPYDYAALEPTIDAETMHLHHDKHHQAYVNNANGALEKHPELAGKNPPTTCSATSTRSPKTYAASCATTPAAIPTTPCSGPSWRPPATAEAEHPQAPSPHQIKADFGDFEAFKKTFNETTAKQFGSGWGWLVWQGGKLKVVTTPNQDSPLSQGLYPILGNDVWEHAYYLKYQNRRPDYLAAWWNVVNWSEVAKRFEHAKK